VVSIAAFHVSTALPVAEEPHPSVMAIRTIFLLTKVLDLFVHSVVTDIVSKLI
jgi:hypothetical protein